MMSNFDRCHNLAPKLFLCSCWTYIIFNFFNSNLSSSPLAFKYLWRVPKTNFLLKFQCRVINDILLCVFFNLFNNKSFQINKTIGFKIFFSNINLFYFWYHLFFLLHTFLLLSKFWSLFILNFMVILLLLLLFIALLFIFKKVY